MKQNDIEVFDLNDIKKNQKKIKKETDYSENNITLTKVIIFVVGIIIVIASIILITSKTTYFDPIKSIFGYKKNVDDKKDNDKKPEQIILKEISYDLGDKLNTETSFFIEKNPNNDLLNIDFSKVPKDVENKLIEAGKFPYTVTANEKLYTNYIIVVDDEAPKAKIKIGYIAQGSTNLNTNLFLREVSDNSLNYSAIITNLEEIDLNTAGEYNVKIAISDNSGNINDIVAKLIILSSDYANQAPIQDLNISYNNKDDLDWDGIITEKLSMPTTLNSALYNNALNRIRAYNWATKINQNYLGAKIESDDILILYNQHDLIVGLTVRVKLKIANESKFYYLSY